MVFSTPIFLFLFLPAALTLYFLTRGRLRILIALAASLVFYAWGNPVFLLPMLGVIGVNYGFGIGLERRRMAGKDNRWLLAGSILFNLILLVFYKALAGFGADLLTQAGHPQYAWIFNTPLGLSYIAFQVISYLVDVQEEKTASEKNPLTFALYILLFPRVIAGPITPYRDLREQLVSPRISAPDAASGIRRFILGLAKKLLIADQLAVLINPVFQSSGPDLTAPSAWLVIFAYALQLYFDFSGYTDMAIGLGRAMGFRFAENFNFPYLADSLSDFWRRWHMSLVGWFREYVFYPLEFIRRKSTFFRPHSNILLVFLLTGLWHGVTWNFLVWGALHGLALALELTRFGRWMKSAWAPVRHAYTLLVVLVGWVFFRSPDMRFAADFLQDMGRFLPASPLPLFAELSPIPGTFWMALVAGVVFCLPVAKATADALAPRLPLIPERWKVAWTVGRDAGCLLLFAVLILVTANATHQAYIYMQF
jgi:alginate O-acetyltransferase complex protein AlgI